MGRRGEGQVNLVIPSVRGSPPLPPLLTPPPPPPPQALGMTPRTGLTQARNCPHSRQQPAGCAHLVRHNIQVLKAQRAAGQHVVALLEGKEGRQGGEWVRWAGKLPNKRSPTAQWPPSQPPGPPHLHLVDEVGGEHDGAAEGGAGRQAVPHGGHGQRHLRRHRHRCVLLTDGLEGEVHL